MLKVLKQHEDKEQGKSTYEAPLSHTEQEQHRVHLLKMVSGINYRMVLIYCTVDNFFSVSRCNS